MDQRLPGGPTHPQAVQPTSGGVGHPELVLYVDPEPSNRVVFLHSMGRLFRAAAVEGGEQALLQLSAEVPAVLITEDRLAGMGGVQLLECYRAESPCTVRVVCTAHVDVELLLRAINHGGVDRVLLKPWDRAELEALIFSCLLQHTRALKSGRQLGAAGTDPREG